MKRIIGFILLVVFFAGCRSSKKATYINVCEEFIFDLNDGTMNGVKPSLNSTEIREWLPCFTKFVPDGSKTDCGGAILYANHDFYFYTYLNSYVEIRSSFKGRITDSLLNKPREQVRQSLGVPLDIAFTREDSLVDFFKKEYGCVRVHYKDNKASIIAAHYLLGDDLEFEWCKE